MTDSLKESPLPAITMAAIGVSVAIALGERQSLTIQTHMPLDASKAEQDEVMDRLRRLADRERAFAELPQMLEDLEKQEREFANMRQNLADLDKAHEAKLLELEQKVIDGKARWDEIQKQDYEKFTESGRRGEYRPQGHVKTTLDALKEEGAGCAAEMQRLQAEKMQNERNLEVSAERFPKAIASLKAKIEEARRLIQ